jgi:hypothetical protein
MATHLRPEELIDLAEGARSEPSAPHLASCEECRRQLADLRATLTSIAVDDVPEPSPIFWDQLQSRVSDAVAAESPSGVAWLGRLSALLQPRVLIPIAATAAIALAIVASLDTGAPLPPIPTQSTVTAPVASSGSEASGSSRLELLSDSLQDDDPSLQLVADLAATLDANDASDAGLTAHGSAEHAVTHLSAPELAALQKILRQELSKAGD